MDKKQKIVVAITGASGVQLALKFIDNIPAHIDLFVVFSKSSKVALKKELNIGLNKYFKNKENITLYKDNNIAAPIASGSFQTNSMIILPCSMNTLAKCSVGIADTLITRVFSVMLKENRAIVVAPREMPYNTIQLENMAKLSNCGVTIAPPILGYYSEQQTLEDMEKFIIGKWFDLLKIEHNLFKRWGEKSK